MWDREVTEALWAQSWSDAHVPDKSDELVHHHSGPATHKIPRNEGIYGQYIIFLHQQINQM